MSITKPRRAVAPVDGVKGNLRAWPVREHRRSVQGSPRPALSFARRNERLPAWGDPVQRSAVREPAFWLMLALVFGSLVLAGYIGLGRLS